MRLPVYTPFVGRRRDRLKAAAADKATAAKAAAADKATAALAKAQSSSLSTTSSFLPRLIILLRLLLLLLKRRIDRPCLCRPLLLRCVEEDSGAILSPNIVPLTVECGLPHQAGWAAAGQGRAGTWNREPARARTTHSSSHAWGAPRCPGTPPCPPHPMLERQSLPAKAHRVAFGRPSGGPRQASTSVARALGAGGVGAPAPRAR